MSVLDKFKQYIPEVVHAMEETVPRNREPHTVYDPIWDFLDRGGKRIRPILFMTSCRAVGGEPAPYMGVAAAIELFHNFTLIHDDIEDHSDLRRGQPTLHVKYGLPLAINAGDGLLIYSYKALLESGLPLKKQKEIFDLLTDSYIKVLEGQGYDIGWETDKVWDLTEDDYFKMVQGKTGALIAAACAAGGIVGTNRKRPVRALYDFGMAVGVSFQIQDDILNIVGDSSKFKKTLREDITEGKRTLMVIRTLNRCTPKEREFLTQTLDEHTTDPDKIDRVVRLFEKYKAIQYADKKAKSIVLRAKKKLDRTLPDSEAKGLLLELADFFINREY